jgi:hypothetical protein
MIVLYEYRLKRVNFLFTREIVYRCISLLLPNVDSGLVILTKSVRFISMRDLFPLKRRVLDRYLNIYDRVVTFNRIEIFNFGYILMSLSKILPKCIGDCEHFLSFRHHRLHADGLYTSFTT